MTCPVDKAWMEKVESSAAMEASNLALVKCKHLPSQKRQQASGPHIFCPELVNSILCAFHLLNYFFLNFLGEDPSTHLLFATP